MDQTNASLPGPSRQSAVPDLGVALLRASPSAVVATDAEGRITMLNAAAERLFSTTGEAAVGLSYTRVFGASVADRMLGLFLRVARSGGGASPQTVKATLPDGRRATLRASTGPLRDATGGLLGILFVADEVSLQADTAAAGPAASAEADRARQALQRYLGAAVAARLDRPSFIGVGGVRQTISVLHADVRGYTTLAELLEPEEISALLLRYHGAAVAALEEHGATIDRYIGDAILALWNAPAPQEQHARLALRGALALRAATQAVGCALEYGIGVHTGEAVVGNLGSERLVHYTAIGDTVNVAARLQGAAPAGGIICSAVTLAAAGERIQATSLGPLTVKGRKNPVDAYSVQGVEP